MSREKLRLQNIFSPLISDYGVMLIINLKNVFNTYPTMHLTMQPFNIKWPC